MRERIRIWMRWTAAAAFVLAGANHFRDPGFYLPLIPEVLGWPAFWNAFTGLAEVAGGIGLLVTRLRKAAAWGLIVMLLGFLWVHVDMLVHPEKLDFGGIGMPGRVPAWVLWARLPFQFVLIAWVAWVGDLRLPTDGSVGFKRRLGRGDREDAGRASR